MRRFSQFVMILLAVLIFNSGTAWSSLARFVDMEDGTVLDRWTYVRWLKDTNCFYNKVNWYDAMLLTVKLASGQCGLTDGSVAGDWRLPSGNELSFMSSESVSEAELYATFAVDYYYYASYWTSSQVNDSFMVVRLYPGAVLGPFNASTTTEYFWPAREGHIGWLKVAPALTSKDFGTVPPNTSSASQTFTISNDGAITVALNILLDGGDTGMFTLDKGDGTNGTCGATPGLDPGASCTVSVSFTPTKLGGKSTNLRIYTTNAAKNPDTSILLSGNNPDPTVSWWKGENDATDSVGSNNGITSNTITATVAENQTATALCSAGSTITSFTSVYGADPNWVNCGSCEIGSSSCSVAYSNTACGDPYLNQTKQGKLAIVCGSMFAPGKLGQAFNFDGTGQYVAIPSSTTLDIYGTHAVAFWVKPAAYPASGKSFYLVNKWTDGQEDKRVTIDSDGKVHYFLFGTSASAGVTSTTAVQTNVWTHVVATYDGTDMKIYLNGVLDASVAASGDVLDSTGPLCLGYNPLRVSEGLEEPFTGQLDEVGWYNQTLSASEVSLLANMVPDAFSFTARTGMPLNVAIFSNPVTVTGITAPTVISITNGDYSVSTDNGATWGDWTNISGTIAVNSQVRVRLTSSATAATQTSATLTIGAVSGVFNVTTAAAGDPIVTVNGLGLVSWWQAENNANDTLNGNDGLINNTQSVTVAENQTAILSCGTGSTITSFTSVYGADPKWVNCGSCETGSSSCSVTYSNTICGDPYPGHVKQGVLSIVCDDAFAPGKAGQAFNSPAQNISVPHSSSLNISGAHTVAFWVKLAEKPASGKSFYLVNKWTDGNEDKLVSIDSDGRVHYYLLGTSASAEVRSATALQTGVWTHIVATYDGAALKIYLNGVLDVSLAASVNVANSTGKLYFGYNPGRVSQGSEVPFYGQLDELLWYNRALSATEIPAMMENYTYTLTVSVSGNGGGTITSAPQGADPVGVACTSGTCTTTYPYNTPVALTATLDPITTFGSWSGDCSGSGACGFTMNSDRTVSATLTQAPLAMNKTYNNKTYATLADALNDTDRAAFSGDELLLLGTTYDGAVSLNKGFILNGGWNAAYLGLSGLPTILNGGLIFQSGDSTLKGVNVNGLLTIQGGSLEVNGLVVGP
ncbi:hypothetical protein GURASL_12190 [Geotalea uraniireducens]|uniref:LamG-like jellyroll fold domain-containing protein n=1 Tax=Geotalea uraniireducens TaxID=351604 RepID=A0ABM8EIN4_9BACT|nr:LamG-like jellyroll fold domain-containing protein [Geotalea uraniireducens]BDV42296.1 hypothetical protein GURASL_12190 [Geotalea uraniireducens]